MDNTVDKTEINMDNIVNIENETVESSSVWEKIRKYKTEINIAAATTFLLAGYYVQEWGLIPNKMLGQIAQNPKLLLVLYYYNHTPLPHLIFYFILPIITLLLLREPLSKYGLRVGDWKKGLFYVAICVGLLAPLLYWASTMPSFVGYYKGKLAIGFGWLVLQYGLYMLSWEFLIRGYTYFTLEERTGNLAIWLSSVPFAIAHMGKPAPETLTCFFGGLVLGYISMKTRSFLYAFLIHWGIFTTLLAFVAMQVK